MDCLYLKIAVAVSIFPLGTQHGNSSKIMMAATVPTTDVMAENQGSFETNIISKKNIRRSCSCSSSVVSF